MGRANRGHRVHSEHGKHVASAVHAAATALLAVAPLCVVAQSNASLPFAAGERIDYRVHATLVGTVGRGSMWIEGPVEVRGSRTLHLRSEFRAQFGWYRAFDRSDSWLDPERMAVLRFAKDERQPRNTTEERVEVFPGEQRWSNARGQERVSETDAPLDELSFIYYVRTLPLSGDTTYVVRRHFDPARNPVTVRVLKREVTRTDAGEFRTIVVEMRVTDPMRFRREGVIKLFLTDDHCRLPVRIETAAPVFGTAVFTAVSITRGNAVILATAPEQQGGNQ
ncbi:MAG TPA: DUF3108 domain-containing protein [Gemmatimonadaceae bacterium]|nr:DUF3108 domain-containing protein [Gemmatimonadaceae bacterium]